MEKFELVEVKVDEREQFINEIQEDFQVGFEAEFGSYDKFILPKENILKSFNFVGVKSYFAH